MHKEADIGLKRADLNLYKIDLRPEGGGEDGQTHGQTQTDLLKKQKLCPLSRLHKTLLPA